jgi:hypothetical protein
MHLIWNCVARSILEFENSNNPLLKVKGWKEKMRNREQWKLVVKEAKAHPGLQCQVKKKIIHFYLMPLCLDLYIKNFSDLTSILSVAHYN